MATHAALRFAVEYPEAAKQWEDSSNSLVVLGVRNEDELLSFADRLCHITDVSVFFEPDIDNEATSLACVLSADLQSRVKNLKLILRNWDDPRWKREQALRLQNHPSIIEGGE